MSGNRDLHSFPTRRSSDLQASYSSSCAAGGYAVDLADLVKAPAGSHPCVLSPDLKSDGVIKSGYTVAIAADGSAGVTQISSPASTCNASAGQPISSFFSHA